MADHYRGLTQSLVHLGFLFRRQGEGHWEVWRNRRTDQEVTFDRDEVAKSRAAADAVLSATQAPAGKPAKAAAGAAEGAGAAKPAPRKSVPGKSVPSKSASSKPAPTPKRASKPAGKRATPRKGAKKTAPRKGAR